MLPIVMNKNMRLTDVRARSTAVSALNVRILLSLVSAERLHSKTARRRCRRWVIRVGSCRQSRLPLHPRYQTFLALQRTVETGQQRSPLSHRYTAEVACYSSFQGACRILFIFSRKRWCHRPACISKLSLSCMRNSARLFHILWKGTP
jgi:hypothetical protein